MAHARTEGTTAVPARSRCCYAVIEAPRARYAFNGDVAIAYGVAGDGPVDLVYVQGYVSHVEFMWECPQAVSFFQRLAEWARLITIDRRGTGMSDRFSASDLPPMEDAARDILAVMDALDSPQAAVVGHHEGGQLGAMLAALHPDRVRSLSLIETTISWRSAADREDGYVATDAQIDEQIEAWRLSFGTRRDEQELFELMAPSYPGDRALYAFLSRLQRYAASPNSAAGFLKLLFETDIGGILGSISVPTQVLHRREDRLLKIEYGRELADAIPGAELVELPGGDWWPFLGDTEPLLDAIERFTLGAPVGRDQGTSSRTLATVLFTDIVRSTERAAELGDASWREVLRQHHELVRQQLASYRGVEIETSGDGFFARFEGPARGVRCAVAIVEGVRALGIQVRAGVHTGEVETSEGKIMGIGVHIGARISAIAGPSEVLVSSTVKDLVAGSGLSFEDAGEHELKGVPDTWRLYRVVA
jgi:pimeloyl-ACP methyl ester carboxylesterase/class 3 adenylate cyclase